MFGGFLQWIPPFCDNRRDAQTVNGSIWNTNATTVFSFFLLTKTKNNTHWQAEEYHWTQIEILLTSLSQLHFTTEGSSHRITTAMTSMRRNNQDSAADSEAGKLLEVPTPTSPSSPKMDEEEQKPPPESPQFDKHPQSPRYSPLKAICACILYCFCSVSMVLVNKSLASRYVDISSSSERNIL